MSDKMQVRMSTICLVISILLIFAYVLLLFYVPKVLSTHAESGEELSPILKIVVAVVPNGEISELVVILVLLMTFIASLIWRIKS